MSDSNLLEISVQLLQCHPKTLALVVDLFGHDHFLYHVLQAVPLPASAKEMRTTHHKGARDHCSITRDQKVAYVRQH